MKTNILLLLIWAACEIANAQTPNPAQAIRDLKDGVLIVRLRTQSNKIARLEEYLAKETPGSSAYSNLLARLEETRTEVARENALLSEAFRELYSFSEVLFLYDTMAYRLKEDDPRGIFLDGNLSPVPALSIGQRAFFVAGLGAIAYSESATSNDESLVVYDRNFNRMEKPFPAYSGVASIRLLWKGLGASAEDVQRFHYRKMVMRLDKKFRQYYEGVLWKNNG